MAFGLTETVGHAPLGARGECQDLFTGLLRLDPSKPGAPAGLVSGPDPGGGRHHLVEHRDGIRVFRSASQADSSSGVIKMGSKV